MRWEALFADLEAQLEQGERAEEAAEIADRTRRELAGVSLLDRLRGAQGRPVTLALGQAGTVRGTLAELGPDWLLVTEGLREHLVPLLAVCSIAGLPGRGAAPLPDRSGLARLRLGAALRGLVRDRVPVAVTLTDGTTERGTLDRVGADCVDLAVHPEGELRRSGAVTRVLVVPFHALGVVRSG